MPLPHFSTSITLVLTIFKYFHPSSSQSTAQSSPPTAVSSLPAISTLTVFPSYNFTYPTFPDLSNSAIEVSYKDTIDVSWIANGAQHAPVLQIQCWARNDSSSFIYYQTTPSYTHNLITSPNPSLPLFPLPLAPYRKYSPCQLQLLDPDQTNIQGSESVASVAFFISQKTNASTAGVTWSVEDPAPKVAVDAGVSPTNSGSAGMDHDGVVGGMWTFVGVAATAMVLL